MVKSEKQRLHLEKLNANQKNENNRAWKGNKAGYTAVHHWVNAHLSKPDKCDCGSTKKLECANLDGKYSRDLSTWKWMCRSCHLRMDDVANKAWKTKRGIKPHLNLKKSVMSD